MMVLTAFNARQESLFRPTISDGDLTGLRSLLHVEISKWLNEELQPVEQHFAPDADDVHKDILERFLMYLVRQHGEKGPTGEYGRNVSEAELNLMIGAEAKLDIENDKSVTMTVRIV